MPEIITELIVVALIAAIIWVVFDGLHVRELAVAIAKSSCLENNVQLLDGTVVPKKFAIARAASGGWVFRRTFRFEFSSTGDNRLVGQIVMDGKQHRFLDMENLYMEGSE